MVLDMGTSELDMLEEVPFERGSDVVPRLVE